MNFSLNHSRKGRPSDRRPSLTLIGLLSLIFLLLGCQAEPAPPVQLPAPTDSVSLGQPTAVEPPTTIPPATATATAAPTPLSSPTATPFPTATAVPLPLSDDRCGQILPLLSPPMPPQVTQIDGRLNPNIAIPENAAPALSYLLENPANVGLVAFRVGLEGEGVYLNENVPMPLASVAKLIHLVAYAEAAADGRLNPADWLPVSELDRFYLQGSDLRSHPQAIEQLLARRLISGNPQSFPMEELPWMMMRNSSNAASDYLQVRLGQGVIEETAVALGLTSQTAPCPFLGQFLTISNHTRDITQVGGNEAAIQALIDDPDAYGQLVMDLTMAFSEDADFRAAEGRWYQRARRPSWEAQALFSENLNAQGSAGDYANLMATIAQNQLSSAYVNIITRRNLEWPLEIYPLNQELFYNLGYKNGSLPGILTTVYYAAPREGGGLVVVALFFRNLPEPIYNDWRRNLYHDDLARWLLTDPQAIPALRAAISN